MCKLAIAAACAAVAAVVFAGPAQAAGTFRVGGVRTQAQRSAVARTGAAVVEVHRRWVLVTASRGDLRALRRAGFRAVARARIAAFPAADSGYHNYAEMVTQIQNVAAANPGIVQLASLGKSYQGRDIWR